MEEQLALLNAELTYLQLQKSNIITDTQSSNDALDRKKGENTASCDVKVARLNSNIAEKQAQIDAMNNPTG